MSSRTALIRFPSREARLALAFAAIYLVWGSTYLAIRYAIETLPPLLMMGLRHLGAGGVLFSWSLLSGTERPERSHWRSALLIGGLLFLGGHGSLAWAEQQVPSGLAALLSASVPFWVVLLEAIRPGGGRPGGAVLVGLLVGLAGLGLLVGPAEILGSGRTDSFSAALILMGSLSWAVGTLYARGAKLPASLVLASGMEMLTGGALLLIAGCLAGEPGRLDPASVSLRSVLGLLYLMAFGSLLAFTAYTWLLGATSPVRIATYAYVNPPVAVFIGWAIAGEPVSARTLLSTSIIVAAVALIITHRSRTPEVGELRSADLKDTSPRPGAELAAPSRRRSWAGALAFFKRE